MRADTSYTCTHIRIHVSTDTDTLVYKSAHMDERTGTTCTCARRHTYVHIDTRVWECTLMYTRTRKWRRTYDHTRTHVPTRRHGRAHRYAHVDTYSHGSRGHSYTCVCEHRQGRPCVYMIVHTTCTWVRHTREDTHERTHTRGHPREDTHVCVYGPVQT